MSHPRVCHISDRRKGAVRVDRTTPYGNPFRIGVHGDRARVILLYRRHLREKPALVERIRRNLQGALLECWCAPEACHADVIAEVADGGEP